LVFEEEKKETMQHDPSLPPLIPETLLKRRRSLEDLALKRVEHVNIKRPEQYVREFRIVCQTLPSFSS
jgi:hypothetical protein